MRGEKFAARYLRAAAEQRYRSCLGIMRLARGYGAMVRSPSKAPPPAPWGGRARSYKHVESILKHGLDRLPPRTPPARALRPRRFSTSTSHDLVANLKLVSLQLIFSGGGEPRRKGYRR